VADSRERIVTVTCETGVDIGDSDTTLASITLTKHHGLGNDFLIAVDPPPDLGPEDARAWCDRRRGVGADGLIAARRNGEDPAAWTMTLWNPDGSRAELSGNGLRCLGQALVIHHDDGGLTKRYHIETDGGVRDVEVFLDRDSDTYGVTVDMGQPGPGPDPYDRWGSLGVAVERQVGVDIGNPHLVAVVPDPEAVDLGAVGPAVEAAYPDGINVELIRVVDRSSISLRVWERGAGLTEACGSGACAAVWAANRWDLVDDCVDVGMPGGPATIELVAGGVFLTGPATFVAVVEIERR